MADRVCYSCDRALWLIERATADECVVAGWVFSVVGVCCGCRLRDVAKVWSICVVER